MRDYSDDELAALVKDGSAEAFDLIIDRYYRMVFNYLLRVLANREDAEDALQDVFFKAAGAMAKYRMEGKLKSWIFTIANNVAITKIRKRRRRRVVRGFMFGPEGGEEENPVDLIADESFEPAKTAANNEIKRLLESAVDSLAFDRKKENQLPPQECVLFHCQRLFWPAQNSRRLSCQQGSLLPRSRSRT